MWIRIKSEIGFGITNLLGFDLLPRIKRINKVRLYRPTAGEPDCGRAQAWRSTIKEIDTERDVLRWNADQTYPEGPGLGGLKKLLDELQRKSLRAKRWRMPSQRSLVTGSRMRVITAKFSTVSVCPLDGLVWISPLGRAYRTQPPPIINDLPDPRPRPDHADPGLLARPNDGPILERPPPQPDPPPPAAPPDPHQPPPF